MAHTAHRVNVCASVLPKVYAQKRAANPEHVRHMYQHTVTMAALAAANAEYRELSYEVNRRRIKSNELGMRVTKLKETVVSQRAVIASTEAELAALRSTLQALQPAANGAARAQPDLERQRDEAKTSAKEVYAALQAQIAAMHDFERLREAMPGFRG